MTFDADGSDEAVSPRPWPRNARFGSLATSAKGLWFVSFPKPGDKEIVVRLLRSSDNVTVEVARIDFLPTPVGMSVSPDEKSLLVTRPDLSGSDLFLVNDFRWDRVSQPTASDRTFGAFACGLALVPKQHEAIEAQKLMVNSPNHTVVYIPSGPMGVPLTGTFPSTAPQGPATTAIAGWITSSSARTTTWRLQGLGTRCPTSCGRCPEVRCT